jgi:UDP-glucose 4-epimerase
LTATVAVTGGSGYIGSHVVDALIDAGCTVRVLDQRAPHRADAQWVPCDVLDLDGLTHAVAGADLVYHLAAVADVNDVIVDPGLAIEVNTLGTARVLEAARRADTGRVVLASTVWVYAAAAPTGDGVVDEDTPFDPATDRHLYVTSKVAAEMACRDYLTLYNRPYTILRYGIPYGPRMRDNCVVAAFLQRAMRGETLRIDGDGSQHRHFVYVEDLARAHVRVLDDVAVNRTYNLEGAAPVTIRELAEAVIDLVGTGAVELGPARPGDLRARTVSTERARTELGWTATTPFAEGLARTHAWYLARTAEAAAEAVANVTALADLDEASAPTPETAAEVAGRGDGTTAISVGEDRGASA